MLGPQCIVLKIQDDIRLEVVICQFPHHTFLPTSYFQSITTSTPRLQHLPPIQPLQIPLIIQQIPSSPTPRTQPCPRPRRKRRRPLIPINQIRHRFPPHIWRGRHAPPWRWLGLIAISLQRRRSNSSATSLAQQGGLGLDGRRGRFAEDLGCGFAVHGQWRTRERGCGGCEVAVGENGEGAC